MQLSLIWREISQFRIRWTRSFSTITLSSSKTSKTLLLRKKNKLFSICKSTYRSLKLLTDQQLTWPLSLSLISYWIKVRTCLTMNLPMINKLAKREEAEERLKMISIMPWQTTKSLNGSNSYRTQKICPRKKRKFWETGYQPRNQETRRRKNSGN